MRLIDADALINDIEELITEHEEIMRESEEHPENYPEDYKTRALNLIAGLIAAKVEVYCAPTIVRCNECRCRGTDECPMYWEEWNIREDGDDLLVHDYSRDNGFCDWAERREP